MDASIILGIGYGSNAAMLRAIEAATIDGVGMTHVCLDEDGEVRLDAVEKVYMCARRIGKTALASAMLERDLYWAFHPHQARARVKRQRREARHQGRTK